VAVKNLGKFVADKYKVWLLSCRNDFIVVKSLYSQRTERGHLQILP
jgi:hypothetical protein